MMYDDPAMLLCNDYEQQFAYTVWHRLLNISPLHTWTTVVAVNNTYYFNGIDCDPNDETHCCAVAEGFSITGAGAHILCTTDGFVARRCIISACIYEVQ